MAAPGVRLALNFATITRVIVTILRIWLGAWMLVAGLNHWLPIFPQTWGTTPRAFAFLVSLYESGLFTLAKAIELVGGFLLIFDLFTPLALVILLPVSIIIYYNDAILQMGWRRIFYMGTGCLYLNLAVMVGYFRYYLPMLSLRTKPGPLSDLARLPEAFRSS